MPDIACSHCGKEFHEYPSAIKKYATHYCSRKCYYASGRISETKMGHICPWKGMTRDTKYRERGAVSGKREIHFYKGNNVQPKAGRARARKLFPEMKPCAICGKPQTERHHVDENPLNNDAANIMFLCDKHHSQIHGKKAKVLLLQSLAINSVAEIEN